MLLSYNWAQVLEACDCLKLLSIDFNLCVDAAGVVISLVFSALITIDSVKTPLITGRSSIDRG